MGGGIFVFMVCPAELREILLGTPGRGRRHSAGLTKPHFYDLLKVVNQNEEENKMGEVVRLKTRYLIWPENADTMEKIAVHLIERGRPITEDRITSYRDWKGNELTLIEIEKPDAYYFKDMKSGCWLKFRLFKQDPGRTIREITFSFPKKSPRRARLGIKQVAAKGTTDHA